MAYSLASVTAAESAALARDKPMLVSANRLLPSHARKWTDGQHTWAGTDDTDADGPVTRLDDDFTHLQSFHQSTSSVFSFLLFDFGTAGITFDVVALLNFSCATACTFRMYVDNASDFSSVANISDLTQSTQASRHVAVLSQRVTAARYVSIVIFDSAAAAHNIKSVGEVVFGRRCQLDWRPDVPYDDGELATPSVRTTETITNIRRTVRTGPIGQRRVRARNLLDAAAVQSDVRTWWTEHGGARPFLWIDNPLTAPNRACLMHQDEASLARPYTDALSREWSLDATELGPNFVALET